MNSTTITKKNEEEKHAAHYPSEAFSTNQSICIRNNLLQKAATGGKCTRLVLREREEACHAFQPDAKPPECCAICQQHKDSPSRHVITRHLMPLSLPTMCTKGTDSPLQGTGLPGPSDQVKRARGCQHMRD